MFTENEIGALILDTEIKAATKKLKEEFIEKEAPFLEISDHDFLSLILLTPSVGIALANNSVSLMEEIALNRKARKYSKGGYFMKQDPVVTAMGFLIKHYDAWSDTFYAHIKHMIALTVDIGQLMKSEVDLEGATDEEYAVEVLKAPFIFIRFVSSFFSNSEDEDFAAERKLPKDEYARIKEIMEKIGIADIPLVKKYVSKLIPK